MKLSVFLALAIVAVATFTLAAEDGLRGPVSGLLVDEKSGSIRPIIGIPGSAYADGSAAIQGIDFAAAAPDGSRALVAKDGSLFVVRRLDSSAPVWTLVREGASDLSLAVFSGNASAVAVHEAAQNRLELWRNLSEQPALSGVIDLNETPGRLVSFAVTDDGSTAFAAIQASEESAGLYLLKPGESPRLVYALERAGTTLMREDGLWFSDRGRNEILRLSDWDASFAVVTVATAGHGVIDPVGFAVSDDAKTLFVANGGSRRVLAFDLARQEVSAEIALEFQPTKLERTGSVFLLASGEGGSQPAQVLDPARLKVFFVPVTLAPVTESDAPPSIQ